ncbi:MAG: DUF5060 domain-containing protein [Pseudomonadota bacterium]
MASKADSGIRIWEKQEIALEASRDFDNPYTEIEVWVDLEGPGFNRRVYGFWNGGHSFLVRVLAMRPGLWRWTSGSEPHDPGLSGKQGEFHAEPWSSAELEANPNRRGIIGITADGRGLEYADGTPFFLVGDTWWSVPTFRFPLREDDTPRPLGPDAALNDYVYLRKRQGFNSVGILAALPNWANDGHAARLQTEDGTWLRAAWAIPDKSSAKDMHNEGGRPFHFPGKVPGFEDVVPDYDRINPDYFKILDDKIDYLNGHGIVPFLEVSRRDSGEAWRKYYDWPMSYARYVQYVFARYQANNMILSPIHYDSPEQTIPGKAYNEPCNLVVDRWGKPPFGTLLSANPSPSTLVNFGGADECRWLDAHQIGNRREHYAYWWLTECFHSQPTRPAFNGEPYYSGLSNLGETYTLSSPGNTPEDDQKVRSGMYGSLLSGGYAGYIYGCEGIWQAAVEDGEAVMMMDAMQWSSATQVRHLETFAFVHGTRFRTLVPNADLVCPNKSGPDLGYEGWAYCGRTQDQSWFMLYFEPNCPDEILLRGGVQGGTYRPTLFDPRKGEWLSSGEPVKVANSSLITLPDRPDSDDWGLMLELIRD